MSKYKDLELVIPIEEDNVSIVRDESKCVKCGMCRNTCDNQITVGKMYDLEKTCDIPVCINCGQCANMCPTEAITERWDYIKIKEEMKDKDKIFIFSTSPAVRTAIGEEFGIDAGQYNEDKMVGALRALGADYVLDVTFAADMTICEEASELVERIKENKNLPQFTSCCPSWVKYLEIFYPEFIPNLSTAKSPIGMQGATIKTYFAKKHSIDPKKIVNITVTPCTSKKYEIKRSEMNASAKYNNIEDLRDMDYIITTRELAKWIREENIKFNEIEGSEFDSLLGRGSGAGIIFGSTGGVMEAALRTAYNILTNENLKYDKIEFKDVRGMQGIKEAEVKIENRIVRVAVANGIKNAKILLDKIKNNEVKYDFVEVMNCIGGCSGGGGQPKIPLIKMTETKKKRMEGLYNKDNTMKKRLSHENPEVMKVYEEFYERPLSKLAEEILHTKYEDKSYMLGKK